MNEHNDDTNHNDPSTGTETPRTIAGDTGLNQEGEAAGQNNISSDMPTADEAEMLEDIMQSLQDDALAEMQPSDHETLTAEQLLAEMEEMANTPLVYDVTLRGKPKKYRPGRLPLFYRHEVERIKADPRSDSLVAEIEGVSRITISRIRETGMYKGIPYIARDEVNREAQAIGAQSHMSDLYRKRKAMGRPTSTGRLPPNADERKAIAYDPRDAPTVAKAYGVSKSFVYKMRADFKVRWVRVDPLSPFQREKFEALKHTRDVEELSRALNLPALVVQALLDGEFAQVTSPVTGTSPHSVAASVTTEGNEAGDD